MAYESRKVLVYGIIGILAATILSSSLGIIPNLFMVNAKGTLDVKVTDAPVPDLKELWITISSFEVQDSEGTWTQVPIEGGTKKFDLLLLIDVTMNLAEVDLPVGEFTKIRLKIDEASALIGDETIPLNVPSGHIDLQVKFEIRGGKTTSLIIDIIADKVQIAERGSSGKPANLNPQFKFLVVPPDSSL